MHGVGIMYWPDGDTFQGHYVKGDWEGLGIFNHVLGSIKYECEMHKDKKHGYLIKRQGKA